MTPEEWQQKPWPRIVLDESLSEKLDPLDEKTMLLERLLLELLDDDEITYEQYIQIEMDAEDG